MVLNFIGNNQAFIVFIVLLSIFLYIRRDKLEVQGSFPFLYMLLYKTKLGLDKMDRWSKSKPKLFLYLAYISLFIGIIGIFISLGLMFWQLKLIMELGLKQAGGFVLPIKTSSGTIMGIPVVAPPFIEWLIALIVLVVVHEFAHGVIAQRFKVKIKSSGFAFGAFFVPILPAAFVEPDEKQLKKVSWWKQICVFGAGSTSNFIFGILFYLIFVFVAVPFTTNTMQINNVTFDGVMNESSLKDYNIENGTITKINGKNISTYSFTVANGVGLGMTDRVFVNEFLNLTANETLTLTINNKVYNLSTFENPNINNSGMIGIMNPQVNLNPQEGLKYLSTFPLFFQRLIFWIVLLNIGIGIMNLLPLWITDGGQITRTLLFKYIKNKKTVYRILNFVSYITLILIIFMLWPNLLRMILGWL